jgi:hypothetical protein
MVRSTKKSSFFIWNELTGKYPISNDICSYISSNHQLTDHTLVTCRPGYDLEDTPRKLIWLEDDGQGAIWLNSVIFVIGLVVVLILRNRVSKASFAHTMLKAKAIMGTRVSKNGKLRKI